VGQGHLSSTRPKLGYEALNFVGGPETHNGINHIKNLLTID